MRPVSHYSTNPSHAPASMCGGFGCWNADYANSPRKRGPLCGIARKPQRKVDGNNFSNCTVCQAFSLSGRCQSVLTLSCSCVLAYQVSQRFQPPRDVLVANRSLDVLVSEGGF